MGVKEKSVPDATELVLCGGGGGCLNGRQRRRWAEEKARAPLGWESNGVTDCTLILRGNETGRP